MKIRTCCLDLNLKKVSLKPKKLNRKRKSLLVLLPNPPRNIVVIGSPFEVALPHEATEGEGLVSLLSSGETEVVETHCPEEQVIPSPYLSLEIFPLEKFHRVHPMVKKLFPNLITSVPLAGRVGQTNKETKCLLINTFFSL